MGHLQTHCCQLTILAGFLPRDPSIHCSTLTKEMGSRHELTLQIREPQCSLLADFPGPAEGADRWGSLGHCPPREHPREVEAPAAAPALQARYTHTAHLYPLFAQEVGSGVKHVSRVCRVVVGVGRVVIGFNNLQPRSQRRLGAVQEFTDSEASKHFETKINQRPAE